MYDSPLARAEAFCERFGLRIPVLLAPMAGACPPSLSIAVARAGGLGACGALLMRPDAIRAWAAEFRAGTDSVFQMNLWVPDPPPRRDPEAEAALRAFLARWGPEVPPDAGEATPPDFTAQCDALLEGIVTLLAFLPRFATAAARGVRSRRDLGTGLLSPDFEGSRPHTPVLSG
jgi:nitronate monooxygenase